jgi:hypothetical protein
LAELTREWSRQEAFQLTPDAIQYFRYQISSFSFSQVDKPWQCVAHEENSALIDRFETYVEMSALAYVRADSVEDASYLVDALNLLKSVPDRRVQNMLAVFGASPTIDVGLEETEAGIAASFTDGAQSQHQTLIEEIER